MIIEILQLIDILLNQEVHLLIGFFIFFTILPVYLIRSRSKKHNTKYDTLSNVLPSNITVIVPVHFEDHDIFEKCINSISSQRPEQLIVSIDSDDHILIDIATKYGAEILKHNTRVGKRKALADAWTNARNDVIIHVDSDTILDNNCLKEIIKPFIDRKVVGVSTEHICTNSGSFISYILSYSIELARIINEKALDGNLIVVDGKCSAWKIEFLLDIREKFLNEYWMHTKCEIGDDRFLSREAIKQKFKTVHSYAKIFTPAPDSFKKFLKQQIRWRRSGTKFWIKDLMERVYPSKLYAYKCAAYYLSPIIFPLVIILDMTFFNNLEIFEQILISIMTVIIGSTTVNILIQMIYFGKILFPKYVVLQSLLGLIVILPISVYGVLTIKRQDMWMTRIYSEIKTV